MSRVASSLENFIVVVNKRIMLNRAFPLRFHETRTLPIFECILDVTMSSRYTAMNL